MFPEVLLNDLYQQGSDMATHQPGRDSLLLGHGL